jgi:peptidoglycan hydrolase-like protein with peptidoglycan-binding domain
MNKKLHKSLYSKKDRRPNYPTASKVIESNIDITDSINLDDVSLKKSSGVRNKYTLSLFSGLLLLGIVTYFSINSNTQIDTSRDNISNPTEVSDTIIKSTTTVPMPSTSTSTTTVSTTTTTVVKKEILNLEDAQYQLYELGLYTGEVNGVLDTNTKTAIKEFQKLSGLVVDGILGPITKAALEKGEESYITENNQAISVESSNNSALDLRYYNPNENCITGYVNSSQVWVPDPCFYPVFVYRYGQTAQVNSQAELDAYLSQNWSLTQEKIYNSLGEVPTQNYISGINSPVNGLPMPSGSNNSIVIGIKNDNNVRARPQSGPQKADAVFEVLVEGGMTRFINIFYQSDTSYHGPIRSARPTDPTVLRPLGGVLVASGATGGLIPEINDMGVPVITDRRPEYFRISSRKAPHNLYADTSKLKSIAVSKGYKKVNVPQPLFPWGDPTFENWQNNSFLNLVFSGYTETTWTWNGSSYLRSYYDAYQNQNKNNIHNWLDKNGNIGQISFDTIIALFCEPYVHPLQLPSVKTVGEGRAIILHGGKMLDAKWKRGSNLDPFHIVDNNNNILYVPKGKVWISLVPNTKNPSFG